MFTLCPILFPSLQQSYILPPTQCLKKESQLQESWQILQTHPGLQHPQYYPHRYLSSSTWIIIIIHRLSLDGGICQFQDNSSCSICGLRVSGMFIISKIQVFQQQFQLNADFRFNTINNHIDIMGGGKVLYHICFSRFGTGGGNQTLGTWHYH